MSIGSFILLPYAATAAEINASLIPHYSNNWSYQEPMHFHQDSLKTSETDGTPREKVELVETNPKEKQSEEKEFVSKLVQDTDWEKQLLSKIPFSKNLKGTYHFIKGETDIYVKGLRMDASNRGVSYTTSKTPLLGSHLGLKLKFSAGKENGVFFNTHSIPLMVDVEGFSLKGSATDEDNRIFARYKFALE